MANIAKTYTQSVGVLFLIIGLAAFIPALAPTNEHGQLLLGIFQINFAQTIIHLLTAIVALGAVALGKDYYVRTYVQVFGLVYVAVALWGLPGLAGTYDGVLFGLIHVNAPTELLHIVIGAFGVYAGFIAPGKKA
mgnify:CR=1 FL=1